MKKTILLLTSCLMLGLFNTKAADINIGTAGQGGGGTEVSGTWAKGSNVFVYDHVIIPVGKSLTIEEGVNVQIADTALKVEFIVLGNIYAMGTKANPITISVKPSMVSANVATTNPFPGLWGSIICDTTCSEFLLLYTHIKYYGAATTNNSPSVLLHLYKNAAGQTEPYINFRDHNGGKLVIEHCTFSNGTDDGIYIEGGNAIYAYNTIYQQGATGGDATNIKAGTIADCGFNFYYSPNTNAFKLSNTGSRSPQANVVVYNNTIVNAGWRRPTVKGGGIWYEAGVIGKSYNNLQINDRFGIKTDGAQDTACKADYNYYYGYGQNVVNNFTKTKGLFAIGTHDILGKTAGDKDPLVLNYPLSTDTMNSKFDTTWNFRLKANSPAVGKGTTNFARHFGTTATGIVIGGVTYTSPDPSTTIGALGAVVQVTGITVSNKTASVNATHSVTISASVLPSNADTLTYTWTSLDPTIATIDKNGVLTGVKMGTTKVYAKTSNANFADTCTVTVNDANSVKTANSESLNIYPNPVQSELKLKFNASSNQTKVLVYSVIGQTLINRSVENNVGDANISIQLDNLRNGLYFVNIQNGNLNMTKSFIKK